MTPTEITTTQNTQLDLKKITAINAYHRALEDALGKGLDYAIKAGDLLAEFKADLKHGEWLPWLEDNFDGSARTAQEYMRLAANRDRIAQASSMREAIAELAPPRTKNAAAADLPEDGKTTAPVVDLAKDPHKLTRPHAEVLNASLKAWLVPAGRVYRRWDPVWKEREAKEPDAEDGKVGMPKVFFAEFLELLEAFPGRRPT